MKKILCLLMLFCSLSAFATNYSGKLDVTVGGDVNTTDPQQVSATINSDGTVTFILYDFWYGWIPCGDVTVIAKYDNGTVKDPVTINIIGIPISSATITGSLSGSLCSIHLSLSSGTDNVAIDYTGNNVP